MRHRHEFFRVLLLILQITFTSFGGGNAILPSIHHIFVNKYHWINEKQFQQIVITSNAIPGSNMVQVLGYIAIKRLGLFLGTLVTFIGVLPNCLFAIILYYLFSAFLPEKEKKYLLIINVAVISTISGLLIGFIIKYIKQTQDSGIRLPYILAISFFTFVFCFFVPSPYNVPVIAILIALLVIFIATYCQKRKQLTQQNLSDTKKV